MWLKSLEEVYFRSGLNIVLDLFICYFFSFVFVFVGFFISGMIVVFGSIFVYNFVKVGKNFFFGKFLE